MKPLLLFLLASATTLLANPALYEGFDTETRPSEVGTDGARAGATSSGWLSDWHLGLGDARVLRDDLELPGLVSNRGMLSTTGRTVTLRQINETFTGDVFGSFRVRANRLNPNSMMGIMVSRPDADPMTPQTSYFSVLATRWGNELGALLVGGRPLPIEDGVPLSATETALVLWQIDNLPEMGERSDQVIQMWVLNENQVGYFAARGMLEDELREAELGAGRDQVMQYHRVAPRGSSMTFVRGLVVATFTNGVPKADVDEIRFSRDSLADAAGVDLENGAPIPVVIPRQEAPEGAPNVLFITMDDMNYDSMGAYGADIPNITPHMDSLADEGMRFLYAYNQTSSCVPSRNTYQNGRYPHTAGVLSFFNVDADFLVLPQVLRNFGYFTGCINKPRDTSITDEYDLYWDHALIMHGANKRGAQHYAANFNRFLDEVAADGRPFYCVVNIADPHKPFFNDPQSVEMGFDEYGPSHRFETEDVTVPAFLPDHPYIREQMRNYYNSVKRGDDAVGAVLEVLERRGLSDDTVVIFVSDHGMPLPYAKSSVYADGLRTPWVIRWPGEVEAGMVDEEHLVSAIDFMPTVLDIVGAEVPDGVQGRSVLPAIMGGDVDGLDRVFAEFNDNAGGLSFPMRAMHTAQYAYIFNAWGTGNTTFTSAATWHRSEGVMRRLAQTDLDVAERYNFLLHRTVEEFYDLEADPHALNNLIDDPAYADIINQMRADLEAQMRSTDDYVLEAFLIRDDVEALEAWMAEADAASLARAETLQWKRHSNRAGGTGRNTELYRASEAP